MNKKPLDAVIYLTLLALLAASPRILPAREPGRISITIGNGRKSMRK